MSEREHDTEDGKGKGAQAERGEEQEPVQADEEESSSMWDTEQHSDAPGPFGTGEQQTVEEAAGNPLADEDSEDE
ncbi:MAG TPA: hypothetical protein VK304_02125 [Thermoleophilaceae bacterium]|nr:hypothetical protein [Thermoleophilaceae bacterium]